MDTDVYPEINCAWIERDQLRARNGELEAELAKARAERDEYFEERNRACEKASALTIENQEYFTMLCNCRKEIERLREYYDFVQRFGDYEKALKNEKAKLAMRREAQAELERLTSGLSSTTESYVKGLQDELATARQEIERLREIFEKIRGQAAMIGSSEIANTCKAALRREVAGGK